MKRFYYTVHTTLSRLRLTELVNRYFDLFIGGDSRPVFFNIDQTCPELRIVDNALNEIYAELLDLLPDQSQIPKYHEVDQYQTTISQGSDPQKSWRTFILFSLGEKPLKNRQRCPKTVEVIHQVPGLVQAMFSILDPGKSIPAHEGPSRGYLRYHLPLIVPDINPPTIYIKDQPHTWQKGNSILFDDTHVHQVHNNASESRIVLILDILRPMPWPAHIVNLGVLVFARYTYAKRLKF
ncbi:aspartyl/asparaginyl beta-hydroxylase domain-containing protein [Leptothoe sp. LEGE 181152]|uniref:Aspartyl/asparaginyl beta-hydroxylase domain-containing protein n=1 Tax=Adonisia turfae CCMR0081 TaxID=2292702 RepID=A0A6M0RRI6_9CYAN|nr:aspartyl/asparaginyl beta-hydroxylase domain-containing protein [Adonisia turfae]MDV3347378.1 aspartyl/asparaginyl beta-hydroxylase domain-containing protein [Leptothoe sp. LEGE 181152]NEZ58877.1 aspartyl/asparaginyl beta-hydroxylase domain-containing protein [Adonisia turfae CCMR0081]